MACPLWAFCLEGGPRRVNHSAVVIGRKIFMFGGYCSSEDFEMSSHFSIDCYEFDTVSLKWKKIQYRNTEPTMVPYMRYGHATVAIGTEAYLFGGRNDLNGACNTLYCFSTDEFLWFRPKVSGMIPGARDGHGMCVARGNIYVFGGYESETDGFSEQVSMLDMKAMTWVLLHAKGHYGLWRDFHTLTTYKDKIYLFGGRADESGAFAIEHHTYENDIKVLDLDDLEWTSVAKSNQPLPIGRRSHTTFVHNDCLYIFGGYNSSISRHFNDLWKYDPGTGLWTEIHTTGERPCQRRRHCCCYLDNKAYIFGGTSPLPGQDTSHYKDLQDLSDMHILDLESSLKSICIYFISKNRRMFDISCLPLTLKRELESIMTDGTATPRNVCQG